MKKHKLRKIIVAGKMKKCPKRKKTQPVPYGYRLCVLQKIFKSVKFVLRLLPSSTLSVLLNNCGIPHTVTPRILSYPFRFVNTIYKKSTVSTILRLFFRNLLPFTKKQQKVQKNTLFL